MAQTIVGKGAEATLFLSSSIIIKDRTKKKYRIPEIDIELRKSRTRREAKVLRKLEDHSFPAPKLIEEDRTSIIKMSFIEGEKVRDEITLMNCKDLGHEIGMLVRDLHALDIIHGDLTTSNMIYAKNKVHFIDFGLSFFSKKVEDRAVDLHLLKQALESKHHEIWEDCFNSIISGYSQKNEVATQVFTRLKKVEARGRNKK
jgi:TP53 regulating kinase and related kinases